MPDIPKKNNCYQRYQELGGIINEKDYENALQKAKTQTRPERALILQAELIAQASGIDLRNAKDAVDQRTILYSILRTDVKPEGIQYHHSQMCDQRLFAEALRMLGDTEALFELISAYPHISF